MSRYIVSGEINKTVHFPGKAGVCIVMLRLMKVLYLRVSTLTRRDHKASLRSKRLYKPAKLAIGDHGAAIP